MSVKNVSEDQLFEITESVWSMILGLPLVRSAAPASPTHDRTLLASVQISGAFEGVVNLQCSAALAIDAAALMFARPAGDLRPEQVQDALGELTNMVGGNVEALLPDPCRLSHPTVIDGTGYSIRVPGRTKLHVQAAFECDGRLLLVTLLRRDGP